MLINISRSVLRLSFSKPQSTGRCILNLRHHSTSYVSTDDGLTIEPKDQVLWIKLNRPKKYNAITKSMYNDLASIFTKVNEDDSIKALVLMGNGDYYSSGNDLSNLTMAIAHQNGPRAGFVESSEILDRFVTSLINLEKFLIGAVNGPAVGIAVSTLPLFDYVVASDKATFQTPFTALGQCPEACSSLTFPTVMGLSRASELLLLNMTWDAKKAKDYGLVSEVVEHAKFDKFMDNLTKMISSTCYPQSLKISKGLIRSAFMKQTLIEANKRECKDIVDRWCSDECSDAVQKFFNRSKK